MSQSASAPLPYAGSPLSNPCAEKIGEFTALLWQQPTNLQAAIASVRASRKSHQPDYMPMPFSIELVMADGTRIQSKIMDDATSFSPKNGNVRLVLGKWNGPKFTRTIIDIVGDEMKVVVHCNPAEMQNEWRNPNPTIVPPDASGTNA